MTAIIFELPQSFKNVMPVEFEQTHVGPSAAARLANCVSIVQVATPEEEVKENLLHYPRRYAMSANETWKIFPELRHLFRASVERCRIDGWHQSWILLPECVSGDRLVSHELVLDLSRSRLPEEPGFKYSANPTLTELFAFAPALRPRTLDLGLSLDRAAVYLCDGFSICGLSNPELAPGIFFLTPEELFLQTNIREHHERDRAGGRRMAATPEEVTGAFVVPEAVDAEFETATISRIMTAAALVVPRLRSSVFKRVLYARNGWVPTFVAEPWRMSFHERPDHRAATIDYAAPVFSGVLGLLQRSNAAKFRKAKDDYRLLALDTISDKRQDTWLKRGRKRK
jgi:hypothetical protein